MKNVKTIIIAMILTAATMSVNANSFSTLDKSKKTESVNETKVTNLLNVIEEELKIENWMIQPKTWKPEVKTEEVVIEENLALEDWMCNIEEYSSTKTEEALTLESWMFNF